MSAIAHPNAPAMAARSRDSRRFLQFAVAGAFGSVVGADLSRTFASVIRSRVVRIDGNLFSGHPQRAVEIDLGKEVRHWDSSHFHS
jgi:hypothetical protein